METHIYIKYAVFIIIVYFVTSMMYGTPINDTLTVDAENLAAAGQATAESQVPGWNPLGLGIYNAITDVAQAVASAYIQASIYIYAGLRMLTFDFTGLPWFLHIFLGMINVVMIIFFILDFIRG